MRTQSRLTWLFAVGAVGVACNAVFGLDQLEEAPSGGAGDGQAGDSSGGTAGTGKGGSAGSNSSNGGSSGRGGSATGGTAGESGGGMGGGGGDCTPDDEAECRDVDSTLIGNCARGTVTCQANGTWGTCSVIPADADSCEDEGDDADCDGTPNGGCPCVNGEERACGPQTDDGICQFGTQTCEDETWGTCDGAVLPEIRDCLSPLDNDCDGAVDNARDDECPCAVDGAHVCVEDAPTDWEGPMAVATVAAAASSPSCSGTGYERQVLTKLGGVDPGDAMCGCTCGTPSHGCGAINMRRSSISCIQLQQVAGPIEYPNLAPNTCSSVTGSGQNFYPLANYMSGTCVAQPSTSITRARFTERMTGCETNSASPDGCSAQSQCVPELDSPLESFCIYRDGEPACPSGPYSARSVFYDDLNDPRSCSTCTCGASTGSCTGTMGFASSCASTIETAVIPYGGCGPVTGGATFAATSSSATPTGMCAPNGGTVQGSVSTTGAVTMCCKP